MINLQIKDVFYKELIEEPTIEKFREFVKNNCGEFDNIDFKENWIERGKLSKLLLSLANSQGGIIVFGLKEENNHSIVPTGLTKFKDKADINSSIAKYVPPELDYQVLNFEFESSEYEKLKDKKFQLIVVSNTPERLPFISLAESDEIEKNIIYVRRGTKCERATKADIDHIIELRIATIYSGNSDLTLDEHLNQLKTLYNELPKKIDVLVKKAEPSELSKKLTSITQGAAKVFWKNVDEYEEQDNPNYPSESYEAFVLRMVNAKKLRIEKVLDVK